MTRFEQYCEAYATVRATRKEPIADENVWAATWRDVAREFIIECGNEYIQRYGSTPEGEYIERLMEELYEHCIKCAEDYEARAQLQF